MVGVNYDEAIHKVYSRKKAAIDERVGFFFKGILLAKHFKVKHVCFNGEKTVYDVFIRFGCELYTNGPMYIFADMIQA